MLEDAKHAVLTAAVADLIGLERSIEHLLDQHAVRLGSNGDGPTQLRTWRELAASHRDALHEYQEHAGANDVQGSRGVSLAHDADRADTEVGALREAHAAFSFAVTGYIVLSELAFRLYEPPLRELAPKHLRDYVQATQAIHQMMAGTVAADLHHRGLACRCACPTCSIGACGCVAVVTRSVNRAWRETTPAEEIDGLNLQEPRPGCQLARASIRGGDRLLAVDGRPIRSLDDLMGGIRAHALGEELRLLIQRDGEKPSEVRVSHVGDYPGTTTSR